MAQSSKTARWLDLLAFLLQHHYPVTREDILARVTGYRGAGTAAAAGRKRSSGETARRMFERDKVELRNFGIQIETVDLPASEGDEPQQGYRLKPSAFYLPYFELASAGDHPYAGLPRITLSEAEAAVLDRATRRLAERTELPLGVAAASARRKLAFDLPLDEETMEQVLAAPLPEAARRALEVLQDAVMMRTPVSCRYYSLSRNTEERREIEPFGLFFQWSQWYCVARARDRDALRVFRVDRMREAALLEGQRAFDVPGDFDIRHFLRRAPWEFGEGPATTVRVRFSFPESRWVLNQQVGTPVTPVLDDGGAIISFAVRDRATFLRWLLTFRRQAMVLDPADIASELEALRRRIASLYATDSPETAHPAPRTPSDGGHRG